MNFNNKNKLTAKQYKELQLEYKKKTEQFQIDEEKWINYVDSSIAESKNLLDETRKDGVSLTNVCDLVELILRKEGLEGKPCLKVEPKKQLTEKYLEDYMSKFYKEVFDSLKKEMIEALNKETEKIREMSNKADLANKSVAKLDPKEAEKTVLASIKNLQSTGVIPVDATDEVRAKARKEILQILAERKGKNKGVYERNDTHIIRWMLEYMGIYES